MRSLFGKLAARSEKRVLINLGVFLLIGILLIAWATINVLRPDFLERPFRVTASFETSPGLRPGFQVAFLGVQTGTIDRVELGDSEALVTLRLDRGTDLPQNVGAAVRRQSAVGEPFVDLTPPPEGEEATARLSEGDHIPIEATDIPIAYSELFEVLDELVLSIDPDALRTLFHELAEGLEGRGQSIRQLLEGGARFTTSLAENADLFDAVIEDLTRLTGTLARHSEAIGEGFDNLALLAQGLRDSRRDVVTLLEEGPGFSELVAGILTDAESDLSCMVGSGAVVVSRLGQDDLTSDLARLLGLAPQAAEIVPQISTFMPDGRVFVRLMNLLNAGVATEPVEIYQSRSTLPVPAPLPECPPVPARDPRGPRAAPGLGGTARPEAETRPVEVSERPETLQEFPDSSTMPVGTGLPLLALLAILTVLAAVAVAWRFYPLAGSRPRAKG